MMTNKKIGEFVKALVTPHLGDDLEFTENLDGSYRNSWEWHRQVYSGSTIWRVKSKKGTVQHLNLTARCRGHLMVPSYITSTAQGVDLSSPSAAADIVTFFMPEWIKAFADYRVRVDAEIRKSEGFRRALSSCGFNNEDGSRQDSRGDGGRISLSSDRTHTVDLQIHLSAVGIEEAAMIVSFLNPFVKTKSVIQSVETAEEVA